MMQKIGSVLLILLLIAGSLSAQERPEPAPALLKDLKLLIKTFYPVLNEQEFYAEYTIRDVSFSRPVVPWGEVFVRVEKYCWAKADPKSRALPINPHRPCSSFDSNYKPELTMTIQFANDGESIHLDQFVSGGQILSTTRDKRADSSEHLKYGPEQRAEVISHLPVSLLEKVLGAPLTVTEVMFDSSINQWCVRLKGPSGRYVLWIEPVHGYPTQLGRMYFTQKENAN